MSSSFASLPDDDLDPSGLVEVLLSISLTGTMLLRPLYAADGATITDFTWGRLNEAAQRLLRLPERPADSFLTLFPSAPQVGVFQFYQDAFHSGRLERRQNLYQHDGLDGYYVLVAQRHGPLLVVNFTDSNDRDRMGVEEALRQSQAHEQHRAQELEAANQRLVEERENFYQILEQAPAAISILRGEELRYAYVNPVHQRLVPGVQLLGRTAAQVRPDAEAQALIALIQQVYRTGEQKVFYERPVEIDPLDGRPPQQGYFTFAYSPLRENGQVTGVSLFSFNVTEVVLARQQREAQQQQVQNLNEELAASNEELRATNEEYLLTNTALNEAQQQLRQLNEQLETRVQQRTAQLAEQQDLLRQILSQVPAGVATLSGPEHRFSFFNATYEALSGRRPALGQTVAEVFPEVVEQGFLQWLDQVYATGQPFTGADTPVQLLDARSGELEQRYVDFAYQPLHDEQGQTQGILAFILDTTDAVLTRRQNETMLATLLAAAQRQAQQRQDLYQVFEQTPAAVMLLRGPQHRVEYANQASERLLATRLRRGLPLTEGLPEAVAQGFLALLDGVYQTGETYLGTELPFTVEEIDRPPRTIYFNFSYQAYREQDQIAGISVFAYDVSEQVLVRRQAETLQAAMLAVAQHQAQQRQDLYQVFEQTPAAIVLLREPDHRIEYFNPAFAEVFPPEQARDSLRGLTLAQVYPRMQEAGLVRLIDRVYQTGEAQVVLEMPLADLQPGSPRYITLAYQAYRENDQIVGVAAFAYDATEQVLARQQVLALNGELAASNADLLMSNTQLTLTNQDLDSFVYIASHDLRAPITNIEGLLLALRDELPGEVAASSTIAPLLRLMDGAVDRFQYTLGHLTSILQLQRAGVSQTEDLNLARLIEDVRLDVAPLLAQAGGQLVVEVAECPLVHFSPKNLRSILYNLLSNAFKYRALDRPPLVQVRARRLPGQWQLQVQDNGLGLSSWQQGRLFQLFQRLHTHVEGTGIGLYTIKKLIEQVQGTIEVESEPGVGTTFTLTFPA